MLISFLIEVYIINFIFITLIEIFSDKVINIISITFKQIIIRLSLL